jgi:hypothetical protein
MMDDDQTRHGGGQSNLYIRQINHDSISPVLLIHENYHYQQVRRPKTRQ